MKQVIVTTSWDDGDPLDLRVAEMLAKHGLKGTFYIPIIGYMRHPTLAPEHMRNLVQRGFEIGAHSFSHITLRHMKESELHREVQECRARLQDTVGTPITMFCYPNGGYDRATLDFVRRSGYTGARTTRMLRSDIGNDPLRIPTTLQAFPHSRSTYFKNALKGRNLSSFMKFTPQILVSRNWIELGMRCFDYVLEHGGVWHLYGHSWELQECRLWQGLETLLDYVAQRKHVHYLSNGEMAAGFFAREPTMEEAAA